jgi:hypothetical protein
MKKILFFLVLLCMENVLQAQYVYTIKADSVKITNSCDTAELIIENHTQNVPGFLYNKGRGRTEFRRGAVKLNDSMYLVGGDTLNMGVAAFNGLSKSNGNIVLGQDVGQAGNPAALLNNREIPMNGFSLNFMNGIISMSKTDNGTDNSGVLDVTSLWNTSASPTAFKLNVTNTASGAGANLVDIQQDGISKLRIPRTSASMLFSQNGVQIRHWSNATGGISLNDTPPIGNTLVVNPGFILGSSSTNNIPNANVIRFSSADINPTSGTCSILDLSDAPFKPTTGTAVMNMLNLATIVNQTGDASGITRGLYINPTLSSASDFRAIEVATGKSILNGKVAINSASNPTAGLLLGSGAATAGSAPLKFTSGPLLGTAEAGAVEFLNDKAYLTITTSAARKEFTLNDSTLTATQMPIATTNGRLANGPMTYTGASPFDVLAISATMATINAMIIGGIAYYVWGISTGNTTFQIQGNNNGGLVQLAGRTAMGSNSFSPTAYAHFAAGQTTAGFAPVKFTAGTLLSTPEAGAVEFDGNELYLTTSSVRYKLAKTLTGQITTNFGGTSLSAFSAFTTTLTITGAQPGDVVNVSANSGSVNPPSIIITAYVTSINTVTLQAYNASNSAVTIASDTYKVRVIK